ncbi:MAG: FxLYD domain-containing protein [Gemmatimonadaceae bacterium]
MMTVLGKSALAALALATGLAGTAQAQTECRIQETGDVAKASFLVTAARSAGDPAAASKQARQAVETLMDDPEDMDPGTRSFVLGQAYIELAQESAPTYTMRRGDAGLEENEDGRIDLLLAADSALDRAEAARPGCVAHIAEYRQQEPWLGLLNAGVEQLNAGNLDSAETLVERSMVIYDGSPYGYHLLASIAQNRDDIPTAMQMRRRTIAAAGTDTTYADVRTASLLNLGLLAAAEAADSGQAQLALAEEATRVLRQFIAEAPQDPNATSAQQAMARMLVLTGDTASVQTIYADQLANPSAFSDIALINAGVIAAQAERAEDAAALFRAASEANPHHRDALYNLAATLYVLEEYGEMLPIVKRLVAVDPNNPDNWRLYAFAYRGLAQLASDDAQKRARTDSLVRFFELSEKMPVRVTFTQFTRGEGEVTLSGVIENMSESAKTYQLQIEFLDKSGNVVGSQTANVGPVDPSTTGTFSVSASAPGTAAFRYAPLEG